jgi:hypothetical protein
MPNIVHHHDKVPDRTTPQGTQEAGVEYGHETVDLDFLGVARWFIGLAITAMVSEVVLWTAFGIWARRAAQKDVLPSPLFAVRQAPPLPRVWPNPADSPGTEQQLLRGPAEMLLAFRQEEDKSLRRYGLQTPEGGPISPDVLWQRYTRGAGGAPASGAAGAAAGGRGAVPLDQEMPSGPSGGTSRENWTVPDDAYRRAHGIGPEVSPR